MKKIALLLVLVLTVTFCFAGCDMVKLNTERDDSLIVADVKYNDLTDTVTKKELKTFFAQQGYFLIAYAGMSEEEAYKYCADALAQQKLTKLVAVSYLTEKKGLDKNIAVSDSTTINNLEVVVPTLFNSVLDVVERIEVIKDYNKQMQDLIDSLVKEIEQEQALNQEDTEEDKVEKPQEEEVENAPTVREPRPEAEKSEEFVPFDKLEKEEQSKLTEELKTLYRFEVKWVNEKEKHTANQKEAYTRMLTRLDKIGKTYDDLFNDFVNTAIVEKYKRESIEADRKALIDEVFATKKAEIIKNNKDAFEIKGADNKVQFIEDKYKSAIAGAEPVYYHPITADKNDKSKTTGYGYTFNILLKFDKDQEAILKDWQTIFNSDGKFTDEEKEQFENLKFKYAEQIKVTISNPKYNPSKECITPDKKDAKDKFKFHDCGDVNCPQRPFGFDGNSLVTGERYPIEVLPEAELEAVKKGYPYKEGEKEVFVSVFTVLNMINYDLTKVNEKYNAISYSLENEFNRQVELREVFTKWMYMVNDDPGMFSKDNARGYMVPKTGKSDFVESYTNQSRKLMGATIDKNEAIYNAEDVIYNETAKKHFVGNYTTKAISDTRANEVGKRLDGYKPMIAVSEFGIHIIMISEMPGFYQKDGVLMDNAPQTYGRDSYTTVEKTIKDTVKDVIERKVYADNMQSITDKYDEYVTVHEKVYKSLIKEPDKKK